MCDICMHSPCLSGCPNAPDPTPETHCCSCGEPIIPGDEDCWEDLPLCVLIPKLGGEWRTASEEDIPDGYDG